MRVAIVHYWLVSMRGGEKVVEALCDMYPEADIFTLLYDPSAVSSKIRERNVTSSFLQKFPGANKYYQFLLPLMPFALESLDLTGYDLILSSESGPAKGVIPQPNAVHICYCHSPMRYLWDHYHFYRSTASFMQRIAMSFVAPLLRSWDVNTSARVDRFIANSHHVAARIGKYYRRSASVIYPPVAIEDFKPCHDIGDFYLCAGQLVAYKRVDLAIEAFNKSGRKLVIIGEGAELVRLKAIAGPSISFLGRVDFGVLKDHLARCRALVFPGEEDFGIVPVEAMASGRPVIAYGSGGALETVIHGSTGILFQEQTADDLADAVDMFEEHVELFVPSQIVKTVSKFAGSEFKNAIFQVIEEELKIRSTGTVAQPTFPRKEAVHSTPLASTLH
ncbi:glycosyltransferase [Ahrensia sp. 13_GOM-1096m]|uniref:glycosyltransferase n=1 Tax=Ahrensia sp. 13_GOM-1096m TaxID=1380380 RepID=UPI0009DDCA21|nr:glycosyltransferase [Ahrensia sp. 13_GOM-1096m]